MSDTTEGRDTVPQSGGHANERRRLGKGLGALFGEVREEQPARPESVGAPDEAGRSTNNLKLLAVSSIEPLPGQPRKRFDEDALDQLAASIKSRGVIQPIIVRQTGDDRYQLIAGERRWRAAQKAQLHTIPAIIRNFEPREVMAIALIENLQREDLNPLEEAQAYARLAEEEGLTQAEISGLVDKSRSHIANLMRLLSLPQSVQEMVATDRLTMGHARALIGKPNSEELAREAAEKGLSVRDIERRIRADQHPPKRQLSRSQSISSADDADITAVQNHLEEFLGLPVRISAEDDPAKGSVTIRYRTLDQLDLICQRLTGGSF